MDEQALNDTMMGTSCLCCRQPRHEQRPLTGIGHHPIIFNLAQKPLFHPPYNHLFKLVAPLMKVARNIPLKCKGTLAPVPTKNWNTPIQFHGLLALAPPAENRR